MNPTSLQRIQDAANSIAILAGNPFMYHTAESMLLKAVDKLEDRTYNQIIFPDNELPTILVVKAQDGTVMISLVVGMIPPHESIEDDIEI